MGKRTSKHCTMQDIANETNVSIATVSHVLHGKKKVSDATRDRVLCAARKLHYFPTCNSDDPFFRQNKKVIGVVLQDIRNEFYAACAGSVLSCVDNSSYIVVIHDCGYSIDRAMNAVRECIYQGASGIIFFGGTKEDEPAILASNYDIPVVLANCHIDGFNVVSFNHVRIIRELINRLYHSGRRQFLYMTEAPDLQSIRDRLDGFMLGMMDQGLSPDQYNIITDKRLQRHKVDMAHTVLREYLESGKPMFDTILTSSDLIAIGVLRCLREARISVPDQVWVVGYDDISISELVLPPLTTIRQDTNRLGEVAFTLLHEMIQTSDCRPRQITLENSIIVRESAPISSL